VPGGDYTIGFKLEDWPYDHPPINITVSDRPAEIDLAVVQVGAALVVPSTSSGEYRGRLTLQVAGSGGAGVVFSHFDGPPYSLEGLAPGEYELSALPQKSDVSSLIGRGSTRFRISQGELSMVYLALDGS